MILEDRDVERNWNLLIDLTEKWPGGSKQARIHPVPHERFHITREARGIHGIYLSPPRKKQTGQITREARGIHGLYLSPPRKKQTGQEGPETEPTKCSGEVQRSGRRRPRVLCQERFIYPKVSIRGRGPDPDGSQDTKPTHKPREHCLGRVSVRTGIPGWSTKHIPRGARKGRDVHGPVC
jgi:hypothetical protein